MGMAAVASAKEYIASAILILTSKEITLLRRHIAKLLNVAVWRFAVIKIFKQGGILPDARSSDMRRPM